MRDNGRGAHVGGGTTLSYIHRAGDGEEAVLLVVDHDRGATAFVRKCSRARARVVAAHSFRAALDRIRQLPIVHGAIVEHPIRRHSGLRLVEAIRERHPDAALLVWTKEAPAALVNELCATEIAYSVKTPDPDPACVALCVRRTLEVARRAPLRVRPPVRITTYTPREREIQDLINAGCTEEEIAALLGCSFQTVKTHKRNMRPKAGTTRLRDVERVLPLLRRA
jgi:DNA-binding NarL/FixJ family response regulator